LINEQDRSRRREKDGIEAAAGALRRRLALLHISERLPPYIQSRSADNGTPQATAEKSTAYTDASRQSRVHASFKEDSDFAFDHRKVSIECSLAPVQHNPPPVGKLCQMEPYGFSQAALDPVANDRFANRPGYCEPDVGTALNIRPRQTERRKHRAGVTETLIVNFAEVASAEDPDGLGKTESVLGDGNGLAEFGVADGPLVADGEFVPTFGAAARQHSAPVLCFHTLTESMSLGPLAIIRLKRTFWHFGVS
jgi:hypothetical protein